LTALFVNWGVLGLLFLAFVFLFGVLGLSRIFFIILYGQPCVEIIQSYDFVKND
jgi:hypothetical protein